MKREQFFGRSIRNFSGKGSAAVAVAEAEAEAVLFSEMLTSKTQQGSSHQEQVMLAGEAHLAKLTYSRLTCQ